MNDTTVRPFMYEQVSRNCFIQFICGLEASLKFNSLAIFVVDFDGFGFNFNRYFSSSVYVAIDHFIYYGNYFSSIVRGYGIALWIVDIILFQAERLQNSTSESTEGQFQ